MNEEFIKSLFETPVKVTFYQDADRLVTLPYCQLEFENSTAANDAYEQKQGIQLISGRPLSLDKLADWDKSQYNMLYVTNMDLEATEIDLRNLFAKYGYVSSHVLRNEDGSSTRVAFVWFATADDALHAHTEAQGAFCVKRSILIHSLRVELDALVNNPGFYNILQPMNQFTDPNNTTVFVDGLADTVKEEDLRSYFQHLGEIVHVQLLNGKANVIFAQRYPAERCILEMHGALIKNSRIQLQWGRPPTLSSMPMIENPYWPCPMAPVYNSWNTVPLHSFSPIAPINRYAAVYGARLEQPTILPPGIKNGRDNPYLPFPVLLQNDIRIAETEALNKRLLADSAPLLPVDYS
ncbi:U1 snRNP-associated protein Usp109 [Schizosaccharomyces japonicus yFS275]|uniref:U1 snRNP-associated protein Usp109 n=1 Tax=Schizosaccharomyces japonicus (strain yFS275 / FY16936) TaxID=402676 RepID=B6JXX9_SCHJY|nr:U1 snRNP-associated protein Usp109 [Schizosaccharomyces japonicus yFS275]EEB06397.1 U1 snRNP-associated protein Usp109 [Schizosaccharomyces japonicus yFS275]